MPTVLLLTQLSKSELLPLLLPTLLLLKPLLPLLLPLRLLLLTVSEQAPLVSEQAPLLPPPLLPPSGDANAALYERSTASPHSSAPPHLPISHPCR